jgi:hypothetical protein
MSSQQLLSVINFNCHKNASDALRSSLTRCGAFIFAVDDGVEAGFGKLSQEASSAFHYPYFSIPYCSDRHTLFFNGNYTKRWQPLDTRRKVKSAFAATE